MKEHEHQGLDDATSWLLDPESGAPSSRYFKPPASKPGCSGCPEENGGDSTGYETETCPRCAYCWGWDDGASK